MEHSSENHMGSVAVVRVKLTDIEPVDGYKPFAVIAIKSDQSLADLASTIVSSFGLDPGSCYGFYSNLRRYTQSEEKYELSADIGEVDGPGVKNVQIAQVFTPGKQMLFLFDYVNQWHFVVRLVRYEALSECQAYPAILKSHAIPLKQSYFEDELQDGYEDCKDDGFLCPTDPLAGTGVRDSSSPESEGVIVAIELVEPPYDPPSVAQWQDLLEAAVEFRDSRCYQWMDEMQVFGVQDPRSGSIWYCSIFGNSGGPRGLAAYEGSNGLATFLEATDGESIPDVLSALTGPNSPRTLLMLLSDKALLDPEDLKIIKKAGFKFSGSQQWPHFRSLLPGYRPWYLSADEAVTMTLLLKQSLVVANRQLDDPDRPMRKDEMAILTRIPLGDGTDAFADAYMPPDVEPQIPDQFDVPLDDLKLMRLKRDLIRTKSEWEVSAKWIREPIQVRSDSRPFYPIMLVWIDRTVGVVLSAKLTNPSKFPQELVNSTLECMDQYGVIPKGVEVDSSDAKLILDKLAQRMGVQLRLVDKLKQSEAIRGGLYERLKRGE